MYAALFLPQFCLQAALRHREHGWTLPIAVTDSTTGKGVVLDATPAAAQRGVVPGLTSPQALARCSSLKLLARVPAQEHALAALLLSTAFTLSPFVEETGPGVCTLDLQTLAITDRNAWARNALDRLLSHDVRAQIGIAVNPDLALLAARHATPCLVVENAAIFLADLPLADAAPAPEHAAVLRSWGIYTLGALARLAPAELIARLGPEAGELWQQARGKSERLLRLARQPERLEERFDFEHEIETTEPLLFLLRRFLDSLLRRVQDTGRVVARMTLALPLEDGTACERLFVIPSPTAEIDVLYQTLATYLETLHLDQRPVGVRLTIEPALPANDQLQLFESALRDPNRFGETLARLAALVGNDNIGIPQHTDTHRPDAHRLTSPTFRGGEKPIKADADPSLSIGLPLHRYRPPLPAEVQSVHDTPVFLSSAVARGVIADALGPYRLSGDWWGAEEWAVEEWDVELAAGGLFRLSRAGDAWRVEGCYDGDRLR